MSKWHVFPDGTVKAETPNIISSDDIDWESILHTYYKGRNSGPPVVILEENHIIDSPKMKFKVSCMED
jgi:hypothetical protein